MGSFWVPAMTQLCFDGWHLRVAMPLGIVGITFVTLGFPLTLLAALLWERRLLRQRRHRSSDQGEQLGQLRAGMDFSWLREEYAPHAWYWAPIAAVEITTIVAVAKLGVELPGGYVAGGCLSLPTPLAVLTNCCSVLTPHQCPVPSTVHQ